MKKFIFIILIIPGIYLSNSFSANDCGEITDKGECNGQSGCTWVGSYGAEGGQCVRKIH